MSLPIISMGRKRKPEIGGSIVAVLDIDSRELGCFDETDRLQLEKTVAILAREQSQSPE